LRIIASIVAALVLALVLATPVYATQASDIYRKAQRLEKSGKVIEAYLLYSEAAALEPRNTLYSARTAALQVKAVRLQQLQAKAAAAAVPAADPAAAPADPGTDDPEPYYTSITARELAQARQALPPAQLKLQSGRFDFHLNVDPKELFDQVAQRCGLQTAYDTEYPATPQKIHFDVSDLDCREALHAVESATSSFIAPLSSKLIFISKDTVIKRTANEQTMSVAIPVNTALTTQDLTEIAQAVKQVSGIEKMAWSSASNEIVIRDRVSRVRIAKALIEQLTAYRGGVVFDLRFLQLSETEMLSFGVKLTNSFSLIWSGNQTLATAGTTLNNVIKALSHGWQSFGITALEATVVASLTQSKARTLLQTQIRSVNGMPATLHVGDKYPILTSGYFGPGASSTRNTAGAYTPPPSFTYQDLGVSLKILPVIGNDDLITLDVESEYQLLAGQAVNGIPILANRKLTTRISIHNDEWAVIGGLMDETNNKSISGVAGAARIPWLGWLFKTQNREKDRDHIVIVMKPHLVGEPPSSRETAPMPVGTETRPLSPL
jgi:general secretion pathway protein D